MGCSFYYVRSINEDVLKVDLKELAEKMNFHFDAAEADNCRAYLEHVRKLPADAREIY